MASTWARSSERELTRYRAEKIGFVFQQFHLVPYLSAVENVMLAQYFHSVADEAEAVRELWSELAWESAWSICPANFPAANSSAWLWPVR